MQGEITSSLNVMISAHENSKKQLLFANAAENQALAEAKRMQTEEARIATSERNIAEINANLTSPFLTEDPATTVSYSNPNRCVEHVFSLSVSLTVLQFFFSCDRGFFFFVCFCVCVFVLCVCAVLLQHRRCGVVLCTRAFNSLQQSLLLLLAAESPADTSRPQRFAPTRPNHR